MVPNNERTIRSCFIRQTYIDRHVQVLDFDFVELVFYVEPKNSSFSDKSNDQIRIVIILTVPETRMVLVVSIFCTPQFNEHS